VRATRRRPRPESFGESTPTSRKSSPRFPPDCRALAATAATGADDGRRTISAAAGPQRPPRPAQTLTERVSERRSLGMRIALTAGVPEMPCCSSRALPGKFRGAVLSCGSVPERLGAREGGGKAPDPRTATAVDSPRRVSEESRETTARGVEDEPSSIGISSVPQPMRTGPGTRPPALGRARLLDVALT
jgi:hypothetical protein